MNEHYLYLDPTDQQEILEAGAAHFGRRAAVLEKDIWVCWALETLFSIEGAHPMAFKGGTSLSKIYQAIHRFSEDIDITLDYRYFDNSFDPFDPQISKTQLKRANTRLKHDVHAYANEVIRPAIQRRLNDLPIQSNHPIEMDEHGEKLWISYPSVTESNDPYLKSRVLIELGGRNVINPNERHIVRPDVALLTPNVDYPTKEVTVLSIQRTFWEKATLIHVECNRNRFSANANRQSRHWYDLFQLSQHSTGRTALDNRSLLEDVIRHKKIFFNASYAQYDSCLQGALQLIPTDSMLKELKSDYEKMTQAGMLYGLNPSFEAIINALQKLEHTINREHSTAPVLA